jgi:hypothetical protein
MKYLLFIITLIVSSYSVSEEYELNISGIEVLTVEQEGTIQPGVLVVGTSLPNADTLTIPYWFVGDSGVTDLTISFMGEELNIVGGFPFVVGDVGYLSVDISNQLLLSGELSYQLTSQEEVSLILISDASTIDEPVSGDLNNGKTDILWRNTSTGQNWRWAMDGLVKSESKAVSYLRIDSKGAGRGDFDGDAK